MSEDEEALRWEIASLRAAISADWVALASRTSLDSDKRKALRDHLDMSTCALRAVTGKLEAHLAAQRDPLGRVAIDLAKLADEIMLPGEAAAFNS